MKKLVRRTVISMLCIITMSQGIYAEKVEQLLSDSKTVESNIYTLNEISSQMKKVLKLDDNYKLEYSYLNTDDTYRKKEWRLRFINDNIDIDVIADADTGKLLSFDKDDINRNQVLRLTKDQVRKNAQQYIEDNYARIEDELVELEDMENVRREIYCSKNSYLFTYARKINNEIFPDNYVAINISGVSGEIIGFKIVWDDCRYSNNNKMSKEEAKKIFMEEDNIKTKYIRVNTDENNNMLTIKPVYYYITKNSGLLDTVSNKFYNNEDLYLYGYDNWNDTCAGEEKQCMIETIAEEGTISREKAKEIITKRISVLTDNELMIQNSYYRKSYNGIQGKYWTINLSDKEGNIYVYAAIDAITGELINISYDNYNYCDSAKITYGEIKDNMDQIKTQGTNIVEKIFPDINKADYRINVRDTEDSDYSIYIDGVRVIKGIDFDDNRISLTYDISTGKFSSVSIDWFNNIKIIESNKKISKEEANDIFYSKVGFTKELVQLRDKKIEDEIVPLKKLSLIYKLKPYNFQYIDIQDGKFLDYHGDEYKETVIQEKFTDLKDCDNKQTIELMNKMGYIEETNEKFNPNKVLTKKDAIKWIVLLIESQRSYIPDKSWKYIDEDEISFIDIAEDDEYRDYIVKAVRWNVIQNAKYFNKNHKVSLIDMIEWLINGMGDRRLANHIEIFSDQDNALDNDRGYVALAKYYEIIDDNTDLTADLKREEAMKILYDFITNLEKNNSRK